ncbi:MAG: hypothetical protein WBP59_14090 [Ilumatobacteraceae bacterium]
MFRVAVRCANLFHDEVEGGESVVTITRTVASRAELDELLERGVDLHGRCYCGHATPVTRANAILTDEGDDTGTNASV